jgi:hypothetical protein
MVIQQMGVILEEVYQISAQLAQVQQAINARRSDLTQQARPHARTPRNAKESARGALLVADWGVSPVQDNQDDSAST